MSRFTLLLAAPMMFTFLNETVANDPFSGCQKFDNIRACAGPADFPSCPAPDPFCSTIYRSTQNQYTLPRSTLNGQNGVCNPFQNGRPDVLCQESMECTGIDVGGVLVCFQEGTVHPFDYVNEWEDGGPCVGGQGDCDDY